MNRKLDAWSEPDEHGVRWWKHVTDESTTGQRTTMELTESVQAESNELVRPTAIARTVWPAGKTRVDVAMRATRDQVLVRATVGGRDTWALLDAGAGITVIDSTKPLVQAFESRMRISGSSATQKVTLGLGELPELDVGGVRLGTFRSPARRSRVSTTSASRDRSSSSATRCLR